MYKDNTVGILVDMINITVHGGGDHGRVPPETKYFAKTKFRRNEMAKRNGEIEIYFGEISVKFRRNEMTKYLFRHNFAKIARRNETK